MLEAGVVGPSSSPWSSPLLLVRKADNTYRFVVDFRKLNAVTRKDAYPLPFVNTILDNLRNARYISSLDIKSAFWQIPVERSSQEKTAFTVPGRGLFHFKRMPFGLHNSPATWQRLMDKLFGHALEPYVFVYLDDIIIIAPTFEKHIEILDVVFSKLINAGLSLNRDKCKFCRSELKYLGYVVNETGLHVDPDKIRAILDIPTPKNVTEVRRFVGIVSWYRRFLPDFATVASPISILLRKNKPFLWTSDAQKAFLAIKEKLVTAPILSCPDFTLPFQVQTDASAYGLGAVLSQSTSSGEKIICYASRALTKQEQNFSVTERECLGVIWAVEKFRPYVEGGHFTVITDHHSLIWLNNLKDPTGRLARWAVRLQQFDFNIIHRKGKDHLMPDLLSRAVEIQVNLITADLPITDPWYRQLLENIEMNPEKYRAWKIEDGRLFKYIGSYGEQNWKIVIPKDRRREVLRECHDAPTAGHAGIYKTYHRVAQLYYWPKMHADIKQYVERCQICQSQKPVQKATPGLMGNKPSVNRPWQMISLDFMEFPRSKHGNSYLLVISDYFSKFVLLFPVRIATGKKLCEIVEQRVFLLFGVPQILICDNGKQFVCKEFQELMAKYLVKVSYNAKYHPQNNPAERVNRTVKTMIRSYLSDDHQNWDLHISEIACAINTARSEVTRFTPFFLNFGREHILSGKHFPQLPDNGDIPIVDHNLPVNKDLRNIFTRVHQRLRSAHERNEKYYNLRHRPVEYAIGDMVWLKNYVLSRGQQHFAAKLAPKFIGPFRVKERTSRVTYELVTSDDRSKGNWHVKDLKPANL